jgi:hypothetical protein
MPPSLSSLPRPSYSLVRSGVWTITGMGTSSR